jgi:hypothetical protein
MSKPQVTRLDRLESLTQIISATTTTLSMLKQGIQYLRTSIAATQTINVPAATGKSGGFNIFIGVTATGNKVIKAAGTSLFQGIAVMTGGTAGSFGTAANSNTITLNGSTQGGVIGTLIELRDVAPGVWSVKVHSCGTGIQVTPFSNT